MIDARPTAATLTAALTAAFPPLAPGERRMAIELYRLLLRGKPVTSSDVASSVGADPTEVEAALGRWPGVFRDRKGRIVGFWGLALRGMPHRMSTSEGDITTWCALDPLIIAPLVTDRARIESKDPVSGEPIRLTVTPHGVTDLEPTSTRMSMLIPEGPFDHDVVQSFCHFVHFFAAEDSGQRWVADHPGTFLLSIDEAVEVANRFTEVFRDALGASGSDPAGLTEGGR